MTENTQPLTTNDVNADKKNWESAKLTLTTVDGTTELDLPVRKSTLGPDVLEIGGLQNQTGVLMHDPGSKETSSTESKITYIDGPKGILMHGGYQIGDLVENTDYLDVIHLLREGELPNKEEKKALRVNMQKTCEVAPEIRDTIESFDQNAHPMKILQAAMAAASSVYHDDVANVGGDETSRSLAMNRVSAQMPTLAAMIFRHTQGKEIVQPKPEFTYTENFVYMMFEGDEEKCPKGKPNPQLVEAFDKLLVLHADHEQNASTSTVRAIGSTGADPYTSLAGGVGALYGPLHGQANQKVVQMLGDIEQEAQERIENGEVKDTVINEITDKYIKKAKDKNDDYRLMGFGHRVYKNIDPRATALKGFAKDVLDKYGKEGNLKLDIAKNLQEKAAGDEYFTQRGLYPNVDFYSGIIYETLDIPPKMMTVMFAVGRSAGWARQWAEAQENVKENPIFRPRQNYTGPEPREVDKNRSLEDINTKPEIQVKGDEQLRSEFLQSRSQGKELTVAS